MKAINRIRSYFSTAFPMSFRYSRLLRAAITLENQHLAFKYLENTILQKKADHVKMVVDRVTYRGSTSNQRNSLFGAVDDGIFTIETDGKNSKLIYRINTHYRFIIVGTAAVLISITTQEWWSGLTVFLWVYGMTWFVAISRHGEVANDLAAGINNLFGAKPEEDVDTNNDGTDKEALKHWM